MADTCTVDPVTDAAEWGELFSRVEHPHIVQSWGYGQAKEDAGGWQARRVVFDLGGWRARRLVFRRDGEPVAICQALDKSAAGVRCATRVNRGPLFLGPDEDEEVVRDVYRALRRLQRRFRGVLVLAPALSDTADNHRLLRELGYRQRQKEGWHSTCLDLSHDEESLRKGLASPWRNRLKAGERSGVLLRVGGSSADLEWMLERHVQNMAEKGFTTPAPAFVRALCRAAPGDFLVIQARLDDEAVGGMLVYGFGRAAEYFVGWVGSEGRRLSAGNLLYWRIALELKRRGYRWFDLGGMRAGATDRFKKGMGGQEYQLLHEWVAF